MNIEFLNPPELCPTFGWTHVVSSRGGKTIHISGQVSVDGDGTLVVDEHGRIMALITNNTDFGDSFEEEATDHEYFLEFSVKGYAFGINALLYAMSH